MHADSAPGRSLGGLTIWVGIGALAVGCALGAWWGAGRRGAKAGANNGGAPAHVQAGSDLEAGRYLVLAGGCNDCHTPGFMQQGMGVPESEWLTGVPVGWRGPWGTTYASNLRLMVEQFPEDVWVSILRTRTARPPMPWTAVNAMSEQDLRAVYRYIKHLGPKGQTMPPAAAPGQEPTTPYLSMEPVMPRPAAGR